MASYRGHMAFAAVLGSGYGSVGALHLNLDWGPVFLGAGLTTVGGFLPDLDSDSGVPVRELFGMAAATAPFLLFQRVQSYGLTMEQTFVVLAGLYVFVRYGLSALFKSVTVHRGMFHSIPAMLISGLAVFLAYHSPNLGVRLYLAGGVTLGFFSHLLLDEFCSVDFNGVKIELNQSAGSAFKFFSSSFSASLLTYACLAGICYLVYLEFGGNPNDLKRLISLLPW